MQVLVRKNNCSLSWRDSSGGEVPEGAVKGGHNGNKEDIYICRANLHNSEWVTGSRRVHNIFNAKSSGWWAR